MDDGLSSCTHVTLGSAEPLTRRLAIGVAEFCGEVCESRLAGPAAAVGATQVGVCRHKEPIILPVRAAATQLVRRLLFNLAMGALLAASALDPPCASADPCTGRGVELQVLGSGGPELEDKRASSSYVVWKDGRAG